MRTLKVAILALVLAGLATTAHAGTDMAALAPADAQAILVTVDAAGLRQMLMESKFWGAFQDTQAFLEWRASPKYDQAQEQIDQFLDKLGMDENAALKAYLGGTSALVLLPSGDVKKPHGAVLVETTAEMAARLVAATGAAESRKHGDIVIYTVQKEKRTDAMAFAGGILVMGNAAEDALDRVLDVIAGSAPALAAREPFKAVTAGLPSDWRTLAYAAQVPPHKQPGAVAMYPTDNGRLHFEWRMLGTDEDFDLNKPVVLTGPSAVPDRAVAAVSTVFYPSLIWEKVKAKLGADEAGAPKLHKAEMFIRGWFPGQTMETLTGAFGPEASLALLKPDTGGAPGLLALVKLTASGRPVAQGFKDGLGAKAMLLAALADPNKPGPKLNVREEKYGDASLLIVELPDVLEKIVGDWDIALTVAVTDQWLIVGTSVSGVKQTLDCAAGKGASLAASLTKDGERVPTDAVTRWGVLSPASASDIVLGFAEKLAGKEKVDQARKLTNLAELLKLIKRFTWQRTDAPGMATGKADIQAIE